MDQVCLGAAVNPWPHPQGTPSSGHKPRNSGCKGLSEADKALPSCPPHFQEHPRPVNIVSTHFLTSWLDAWSQQLLPPPPAGPSPDPEGVHLCWAPSPQSATMPRPGRNSHSAFPQAPPSSLLHRLLREPWAPDSALIKHYASELCSDPPRKLRPGSLKTLRRRAAPLPWTKPQNTESQRDLYLIEGLIY